MDPLHQRKKSESLIKKRKKASLPLLFWFYQSAIFLTQHYSGVLLLWTLNDKFASQPISKFVSELCGHCLLSLNCTFLNWI